MPAPPAAGQVIYRAALADVRRGKVDRDVAVGPFVAQILYGRADTVAAFPHGGIRQAHQRKGGQAAGDIGFHGHGKAVPGRLDHSFSERNTWGLLTPRLRPDGEMTGKMPGLGRIFYCPNYSVG